MENNDGNLYAELMRWKPPASGYDPLQHPARAHAYQDAKRMISIDELPAMSQAFEDKLRADLNAYATVGFITNVAYDFMRGCEHDIQYWMSLYRTTLEIAFARRKAAEESAKHAEPVLMSAKRRKRSEWLEELDL